MISKAASDRSRLRVRIKPNLGPKKQWKFVVRKLIRGKWRTLTRKDGSIRVFRTRGPKHVRLVNLPEGRYIARSRNARGYLPDSSRIVRLRR